MSQPTLPATFRRRAAPGASPHRPDASRPMLSQALLSQLTTEAIDPGYARAAAARREGRRRTPTGGGTALLVLGLFAVGVLLATAAAQVRSRAPAAARARLALVAEIQGRTAAADRVQSQLDAQRVRVAAAQRAAVSAAGPSAVQTLTTLQLASGVVPVLGPGLLLTVDDAAATKEGEVAAGPRGGAAPDAGRVLDRDLQAVVNGLWAAGAEAVSINGQRLTALTAIRSAGAAVLVGYRPLSPPYRISALGDPARLPRSFTAGPAGRYLAVLTQDYGIRYALATSRRLRVPAAAGVTLRHAEAVSPPGSPPERP